MSFKFYVNVSFAFLILLLLVSGAAHAQVVVEDCQITNIQANGMNVSCPTLADVSPKTFFFYDSGLRSQLLGTALTAFSLDKEVRIRIAGDGNTINIIRMNK